MKNSSISLISSRPAKGVLPRTILHASFGRRQAAVRYDRRQGTRPVVDPDSPFRMLCTTLDFSEYVGRIAIGRIYSRDESNAGKRPS